jgi:hypothetical protein
MKGNGLKILNRDVTVDSNVREFGNISEDLGKSYFSV